MTSKTVLITLLISLGGLAQQAPPHELKIANKNSLATAGEFVHTEITPSGKEVATLFYESFAVVDGNARREAQKGILEKCRTSLQAAPMDREILALQWLLNVMVAEDKDKDNLFGNPLEKAYFNFFTATSCARLKQYLMTKHQLAGFDQLDPEIMMRDLNMLQKALIYNSPTRQAWEPVDTILAELQVKPGMSIAEAGCVQGFYSYRLSKLVGPEGMVYALDNDRGHIDFIQEFIGREDIGNVLTTRSFDDNLALTSNRVDMVFYNQLYHLVYMYLPREPRFKLLASLKRSLKPNGRLVVIDRYPGPATVGYSLDPRLVIAQLSFFDFTLVRERQLNKDLYLLEFKNIK